MKWSGWCIDSLHGDACRWTPCRCECHHTHAAEMVAQTFDEGALLPVIQGKMEPTTKAAPASAQTLVTQGLTTGKGWLHE